MSAFQALTTLVTPPRRPRLGTLRWDELYGRLNSRLPVDYVEFISSYGCGILGCWQWLGLSDPLDGARPRGLVPLARDAADAYRYLRDGPPPFSPSGGFPDDFPRPVWPEPGGFLACASSRDGDFVGWLTEGDPDHWPVMVWPQDTEGDTLLEMRLTDVLLHWLRGDLDVPGLPRCDDTHAHDPRFAAW